MKKNFEYWEKLLHRRLNKQEKLVDHCRSRFSAAETYMMAVLYNKQQRAVDSFLMSHRKGYYCFDRVFRLRELAVISADEAIQLIDFVNYYFGLKVFGVNDEQLERKFG